MLTAFRTWLESELKLLGNASHHAYSFGQANMAKRALDRLDEELAGGVAIVLTRAEARAASDALEAELAREPAVPTAVRTLQDRLRAALEPQSFAPGHDTPGTSEQGAPERPLREEPPVV